MREDFEQAEYFVLTEAVAEFDRRLLTIKGWGVSVSLVAVGLGFQYRAFGFFLIAAASSLAFWATGGRHEKTGKGRPKEEVVEFPKPLESSVCISFSALWCGLASLNHFRCFDRVVLRLYFSQ